MSDIILSLLLFTPLVGAVLALMMGGERQKYARYVAMVFSAIPLVISLYLLAMFNMSQAGYQFLEQYTWINTSFLHIQYILGIDGLSLVMVFLTTLLVFLVTLFSFEEKERPNFFFALIMAMELGLLGVYMSLDYFMFYIFWEVTLIPMYFMVSIWGGPRRHYAAIKFFIYTHVASLIMLIGIFALAFGAASLGGSGQLVFAFDYIAAAGFSGVFQTLVFGLLFFGFAVKMPLVPFHTWLPDAHVEAPTAGSVLLAGVMLKMGSYGIIRICFEALPEGAVAWQIPMVILALLAIVYGALACIAQRDLKKMVAFSSISHMGMVLLGLATLSEFGIAAGAFQMFAHGLITAVLFMVCGIAGHNIGTRDIPLLGGMAAKMPKFAAFMMFGFMASLGLPSLVGFVAEFNIMAAFFFWAQDNNVLWVVIIALSSLMLTAGYYLWAMQRTIFGRITDRVDLSHVHDVSTYEALALGALCGLIALFGVFPALAYDFIYPVAESLASLIAGVI